MVVLERITSSGVARGGAAAPGRYPEESAKIDKYCGVSTTLQRH